MKQTVIFFAIIIFACVYWLINFVNVLDEDYSQTPISSPILIEQKDLTIEEKKLSWSTSVLKDKVLQEFPNFLAIKSLIEAEVQDDHKFQALLIKHIENIEDSYICGTISAKKAKENLSKL